jgi:LexA-binding, inner membrane-associated putative hydrolase
MTLPTTLANASGVPERCGAHRPAHGQRRIRTHPRRQHSKMRLARPDGGRRRSTTRPPPPPGVGGRVCAGFTLLPDLDHLASLIAEPFGPGDPARRGGMAGLSVALQDWIRARRGAVRWRAPRDDAHLALRRRGRAGRRAAAWLCGRWASPPWVFVAAGAARQRLLTARERRKTDPACVLIGAGAAAIACAWLPGARSWACLGLPAVLGCLKHRLGDALTISGCPLLWPFRWRGSVDTE